jgi:hypothetical protein
MPCAKHCEIRPTISIIESESKLGSKLQLAWSIDIIRNLAKALHFACVRLEIPENVG